MITKTIIITQELKQDFENAILFAFNQDVNSWLKSRYLNYRSFITKKSSYKKNKFTVDSDFYYLLLKHERDLKKASLFDKMDYVIEKLKK